MKKLTLLFCISTLICNLSSTIKAQSKEDLSKELLPMNPNVKTGILPNGLKYYLLKNAEPKNRAQLRLMVKAGSVLENEEQRGLAHFMEHMNFNGTKNFPKNELVNFLQKSGVRFGADLNAYTSFDETVYMLPVPTDSIDVFKKGIQILEEWAHNATLDPTEIDKERGVVLEESRTGKGASSRMLDKYLPVILKNSQYAERLPIGKDDVLKNFSYDVLKQFHKDFYRPDLEAVAVVGDIDIAMVEKMIIDQFSTIPMPLNPKERKNYEIGLTGDTDIAIVTDPEQPYSLVQIFNKQTKRKDITHQDRREGIVRTLYNNMLSERIQELTKKAEPPFQGGNASYGGFLSNLDAFTIVVAIKGVAFEKGIKAILEEIERVKQFGFTSTELKRFKNQYMVARERAFKEKDKTDSEQLIDGLVAAFLENENITSTEFDFEFSKKHLESISLEEVNALSNTIITKKNRAVILMAPEKEKANLPSESQIKEWLETTGKNLTPYIDEVIEKPLLAILPKGSKTISSKKIPEIGVTEYTFANGVKAVLKPTDFKNDEILISGHSFGGSNLYPDTQVTEAQLSSTVVGLSGLGDFSTSNLKKLLSGKISRISASVSNTSENISGKSSPKDLETTLQLLYSHFVQPRYDTNVVKGFLNNQRDALINALKTPTPEKTYSDTLNAIMTNNAERSKPLTLEKFENINPQKAFEIYKERFSDASDFTFFLVGNFQPDSIKILLEKYLGGLPSIKRKETFKDLKIRPIKGNLTKTIYKGSEPKAKVSLIWNGEYKDSPENKTQIDALAEVLEIKLTEKLREEESGVYGVGVNSSASVIPAKRYKFGITFQCAPENVEKLIEKTMAEIKKVKDHGAEQIDIDKFKTETKRQTELQMRENSFWLSYLQSQYTTKGDLKEVLNENAFLEKITSQSTQKSANYYLSNNNIRLIMLPEKK